MQIYWYSQLLSWHVVLPKWDSSPVPLTSLTSSKVKFEWHSSHQQAFEKIKKVIGTEILLCYPDFNKSDTFHLYIAASDHQLGSVIMQDKKQNNYSLLFAKAQYSSKAVYKRWEWSRDVISYWNLYGIKEYFVRLPFTHHSHYRT
jgi:hypothetical protein